MRRNVPAGRIYGEGARAFDGELDTSVYGKLAAKFDATFRFVGNLQALGVWYRSARLPMAEGDAAQVALYEAGLSQVRAGIAERVKRLDKLVARLTPSAANHRERADRARREGEPERAARHDARLSEHERIIASWPSWSAALRAEPSTSEEPFRAIVSQWRAADTSGGARRYVDFITHGLDEPTVTTARDALASVVDRYVSLWASGPS